VARIYTYYFIFPYSQDPGIYHEKGKSGKHEKERVHHPLPPIKSGVARGAENAEKNFPEDTVGSLKGPSQGEGPRCKASRPMWRVSRG